MGGETISEEQAIRACCSFHTAVPGRAWTAVRLLEEVKPIGCRKIC
jgi:hypothetical protein